MARLELTHLCKHFGPVPAVEDFSLEVESGRLLALVGPSGCGKTTVLRLIAGFETPDAGEVRLDGCSVFQTPTERRGVGVVFQNYALFPHLDVAANVAYGLRFVRGRVDRKARVKALLELVGLFGLEKRHPEQLSAGQRQRVALARALAPAPRVLLLDEPLSALDVQLRDRLRLEIRSILKAAGTTALYVTHDQSEALAIADRVAVMSAGKLEQVDTPHALYHRPQTPFVAQFVGGGNLFQAQVVAATPESLRVQARSTHWLLPPHQGLQAGAALWVLVRPERLSLQPGKNSLSGTLKAREFLGHTVRLHLDWEGQAVLVLCPGDADRIPELGAQVALSFPPQAAWVLATPDPNEKTSDDRSVHEAL